MATKFNSAIARVISMILANWAVLAAAAPNAASWVVQQDGFIIAATCTVDIKTAITVLAVMVEKNGVNIITGSGFDMNAAAVRTPTAGVFTGADANGWIPVVAGDVITVDVDTLTGTSCQGVQVQLDFIAK